MKNNSHSGCFCLWLPNLFDFKGGIQVYVKDLLLALNKSYPDLKITVYDKLDKSKPQEEFQDTAISFLLFGSIPKILQTAYFATSLAIGAFQYQPSLILCGHLNFASVAYWIYRLTGIHYWILVYGVDAWNVQNPIKKQALQAAEKIISISGYTSDRLLKEQNLNPDKISLLPVTFDTRRFQIAPKPEYLLERYGLESNQPVILTVTRLCQTDGYKGYDQIIQALPQIRQQIPNIHYVLVGKGDDRPRIEQLVKSLNLQTCVTLAGFVPDEELSDYYHLCDVFAMPSKGEGFGIVYLEALACGKPTLGGNQDGAIDALCHGELGALVNPDDVDAIAQTLIQILQGIYPNPLMYQPQALRQKVIDTFGFERFQQTLAGYIERHFMSTESQGTD
jgi:glycosyltransferase involved in cell wall biosynthesis